MSAVVNMSNNSNNNHDPGNMSDLDACLGTATEKRKSFADMKLGHVSHVSNTSYHNSQVRSYEFRWIVQYNGIL